MEYTNMLAEYNDILKPEDVQKMDVKSIQKWVGHKDIDATLRIYAKVKDKEAKREISDKMNGIIPLKDYTDQ